MFIQDMTVKFQEYPHKDVFTDTLIVPNAFKVLAWPSKMLCESVFPSFKTLWESLFCNFLQDGHNIFFNVDNV